MEDNFTPEQIEKARQANSPEEILVLAKENNIELSEDKAKEYFDRLNNSGELSDEELDNVSGGGCYYKDGRLVVTAWYLCKRYECKFCGRKGGHFCDIKRDGVTPSCSECKYKTNKGARMLCNHPLNYKR